jgi:methionyl aminopeptidase
MDLEELNILKKSGKLSNDTHKFAKKIIKPGVDLSKAGKKIDDYIIEKGGFPAWPVNLSLNNEAAHNTYNLEREKILTEDDVLKVDIGVSIDGYITDSAQTYIFNKKNELLKDASDKTLAKAKEYLTNNYKTATIGSLGKLIEDTIRSYNFMPVINLTGHYLSRYVAHATPSIPNVANNSSEKFIDYNNQFAIEPFVSTGNGVVTEGSEILIFEHYEDKPIRNKDAKKLLEEIKKFNGLPFSEYWIGKELSSFSKKFALRELLKNEIITAYPVLLDKKGSFVSQAETTFIIDKEGLLDLVKVDEI